jgi:hypothetical protein
VSTIEERVGDLERKATQHDADVHEVYKLLMRIDDRLNDQGAKLLKHGVRLDMIEANIARINDKLDTIVSLLQKGE